MFCSFHLNQQWRGVAMHSYPHTCTCAHARVCARAHARTNEKNIQEQETRAYTMVRRCLRNHKCWVSLSHWNTPTTASDFQNLPQAQHSQKWKPTTLSRRREDSHLLNNVRSPLSRADLVWMLFFILFRFSTSWCHRIAGRLGKKIMME